MPDSTIILIVLFGTTLAAPQVAVHPEALQAYQQPHSYSGPFKAPLTPYQPLTPSFKTFAPTPVAAFKPYSSVIAPNVKSVLPYQTTAYPYAHMPYNYNGQFVKPISTYAEATYPHTAQPYYNQQHVKPIHPDAARPYYNQQYVKPIHPGANQPYYNSQYVKPIAILRSTQDVNFDGTFSYDYEGENGISNQASGYVKPISPEEQAQVMQGQYSYTAPDGTPIITRWYADETGFHAEGAHLPTAQPEPYKTA